MNKVKMNEYPVEPLVRLVAIVREVMFWHRDKESADYNECEKGPCHWCEEAQKAIDELSNAGGQISSDAG